jgi:Ca2+-binding EF-hand superfamily protein
LTWESLFALCKECNITSSEEESKDIILKMGGAGEGFVTFEEFEKFESIIERWKNRNSAK